MNDNLPIQEKINLKLIDVVYEQLKFAQLAELLVFTLIFSVIWHSTNHILLFSWYILCLLMVVVRYLGTLYYKYSTSRDDSKKWVLLLYLSAFVGGVSWGPIGSLLISTSQPENEIFLMLILLGVITVANILYSPVNRLYIWFLAPAYLPHVAWLYYQGSVYFLIIFASAIYFSLMVILSNYIHKYMANAFKVQFENIDLIHELSIAKIELEEAQNIAHLGSWVRDLITGEIIYSKELCNIFHIDENKPIRKEIIFNLMSPDDIARYEEIVKNAIIKKESYEADIPFTIDNNIRWIHVLGKPIFQDNTEVAVKLKGVAIDITQQKMAQEKEKELTSKLISTARQAGMAEIATNVLHNIGNVLNSINVSANLLQKNLQQSEMLNGFIKINNQIKAHADDFNEYLTIDPHGKNIPQYLDLLEKEVQKERTDSAEELNRLTNNIAKIKDIVMMQQSYSNVLNFLECISISIQIESAINMIGFDSSYIIERNYTMEQPTFADKVKLLQILVHLIRNAKDALKDRDQIQKIIKIETILLPNGYIQIKITDNGIGIEPENLERIFSFGYTTKNERHGFGLHISALLAKEMGGALKAISEGHGKGATFILEIPYREKEIDNE